MFQAKIAEFDLSRPAEAWRPPETRPLELAVIIPTFNEAANVQPLLTKLDLALAGICWEAIFVDDNSGDGTADLVRSIGLSNQRVRVLQRIGRRGLSSAVVEGMLATSAPVLAVLDGDMQHDETILPRLFEAVAQDECDLAIGSRYIAGGGVGTWSADRHRISRTATRLAEVVLKTSISDPMSGFFVVGRAALMAALPRLSSIGFKILVDLVASSPVPLRVREIPYEFRERVAGESKLDTLVAWEYAALLLDKLVGHLVPVRFLMFSVIGGLGLLVHLAALWSALQASAPFATAQAIAVGLAMSFNFALNNKLTYRDQQRRGWAFVTGLLSFYAVCLVGATANIGVGAYVYEAEYTWWVAGAAGAAIGAVWNYAASSVLTWRR